MARAVEVVGQTYWVLAHKLILSWMVFSCLFFTLTISHGNLCCWSSSLKQGQYGLCHEDHQGITKGWTMLILHNTCCSVTHLCRTSMNCRRMCETTLSGGSLVLCSTTMCGVFLKSSHRWQDFVIFSIDLSKSKAKKHLWHTSMSWRADGWSSWMCKAIRSPSNTCLRTTMHSHVWRSWSLLWTTSKPSLEIVVVFTNLLTSLMFVNFLVGLVVWRRWACVYRKFWLLSCRERQAGLLVNGSWLVLFRMSEM